MYALLASEPYAGRVRWDRVHFFWGDERCVPPDHPESNYRMARETLLDVVNPPPDNVHRMRGEDDPERGARAYEEELRGVLGSAVAIDHDAPPCLNLVLLGMGMDGHTASLFPGAPALDERRRWVVPVEAHQAVAHRLTLTLPVLNAAAQVVFLVSGGEKAGRVKDVSRKDPRAARCRCRGFGRRAATSSGCSMPRLRFI